MTDPEYTPRGSPGSENASEPAEQTVGETKATTGKLFRSTGPSQQTLSETGSATPHEAAILAETRRLQKDLDAVSRRIDAAHRLAAQANLQQRTFRSASEIPVQANLGFSFDHLERQKRQQWPVRELPVLPTRPMRGFPAGIGRRSQAPPIGNADPGQRFLTATDVRLWRDDTPRGDTPGRKDAEQVPESAINVEVPYSPVSPFRREIDHSDVAGSGKNEEDTRQVRAADKKMSVVAGDRNEEIERILAELRSKTTSELLSERIGTSPQESDGFHASLYSAPEPSLRARIGNSIHDLLRSKGYPLTARRFRDAITVGSDQISVVGSSLDAHEIGRNLAKGRYGDAAVGTVASAVGIIPAIGRSIAGKIRAGVKWVGRRLPRSPGVLGKAEYGVPSKSEIEKSADPTLETDEAGTKERLNELPVEVSGPGKKPKRLQPRVDISNKFTSRSGRDYASYRYGDPNRGHGLDVYIDSHGILGFDIRSDPRLAQTHGSGRDMFNSLMKRLSADGIELKGIRGNWLSNTDSTNYMQYRTNISKGMTKIHAAANTWTGRLASDHGFTQIDLVSDNPSGVIFNFVRPE